MMGFMIEKFDRKMRDVGTIIYWLAWAVILIAFVVIVLIVYNLKLFPSQPLKSLRFRDIEIGQVFYDFGGEETKLRKYIKTGELEAKCISLPDNPTFEFGSSDVVKIEVERLKKV
jgi:hypothetical protein